MVRTFVAYCPPARPLLPHFQWRSLSAEPRPIFTDEYVASLKEINESF